MQASFEDPVLEIGRVWASVLEKDRGKERKKGKVYLDAEVGENPDQREEKGMEYEIAGFI